MQSEFTIGKKVQWKHLVPFKANQVKTGIVKAVIYPGRVPDRFQFPDMYTDEHEVKNARQWETGYVIQEEDSGKHYWPFAKNVAAYNGEVRVETMKGEPLINVLANDDMNTTSEPELPAQIHRTVRKSASRAKHKIDPVVEFKVEDPVQWLVRPHDGKHWKSGRVVDIVGPGELPDKDKYPNLYYNEATDKKPRQEVSYVIRENRGLGNTGRQLKDTFHWPHTKWLSHAADHAKQDGVQTSEPQAETPLVDKVVESLITSAPSPVRLEVDKAEEIPLEAWGKLPETPERKEFSLKDSELYLIVRSLRQVAQIAKKGSGIAQYDALISVILRDEAVKLNTLADRLEKTMKGQGSFDPDLKP